MPSHRGLQTLLRQLRTLASHDGALLTSAKDRLARAEEEMAAARAAFEEASLRADASQQAADEAARVLPHLAAPPQAQEDCRGAKPAWDGDSHGTRTLGEEIVAFVAAHPGSRRRAIDEHIRTARSDLKASGVGPELTRLFRAGEVIRLAHGRYRIPAPGEKGDA
ncbi:hypothetical protein OG897_03905 [Streptomyces sp. NBC_00237]|uniref:hypothetical protein n=1 Tax=Streptomyces sp. NBC_00237 TaxID=2975687 RepID=UPI002259CF7C|nr:hypothetical protein [Streptomyces sp. NBC_00237]MCX5200610.1 hypothetical protein [Streptomyces sp. NBC_00237]